MNWRNVRLICLREVRDQARDRRTLFMIFVLPVLLYPLLGMSMLQVSQFMREHPTSVLIYGADDLPESPKLLEGEKFATRWFDDESRAELMNVTVKDRPAADDESNERNIEAARELVNEEKYGVVVIVPSDFGTRLDAFRATLKRSPNTPAKNSPLEADIPSPEIVFNRAKEKSELAYLHVRRVLDKWIEEIGRQNLVESHVPESAIKPFAAVPLDIAPPSQRSAAFWSKIMPFLLLIWALTGAFYPAVDLCAGEKERGTLETLLSSPAERSEIVWGKLLTIMLFSMATAMLNIVSTSITGAAISLQFADISMPPASAALWLFIALVPMSALFSALCLALAAIARSSKEGQYYLMPLLLVTLPLVVLPMLPNVELTLGTSLIPVMGVMLLLRSMLEGEYLQALPFVPPVLAVTGSCCLLAIRWAVEQFNSEKVLFSEPEKFDLALWLRHVFRDREDTPSVAAAVSCGFLILMIRFFMSLAKPGDAVPSLDQAGRTAVVDLIAVVLAPALFMTVFMARSPVKTLLLRKPRWFTIPAVMALAVTMHPLVISVSHLVNKLYPIDVRVFAHLEKLVGSATSLWVPLLCFALAPAICEEFAYRGFILSGMRHIGNKWRAIFITSIFFGVAHGVIQQSIMATLSGILLGFIAIQAGSILPGIVYHACNNAIPLSMLALQRDSKELPTWMTWLGTAVEGQAFTFHWYIVAIGAALSAVIIYSLHKLPYLRTREEVLHETLQHATPQRASLT